VNVIKNHNIGNSKHYSFELLEVSKTCPLNHKYCEGVRRG
jgi:hypothetical protein